MDSSKSKRVVLYCRVATQAQLDGSVLTQTLEDAGGKYKGFIDALQACMDVVNHNRQELAPQTAQAAAISNTFQDDDSSSITKEDEDLLDDIGEN